MKRAIRLAKMEVVRERFGGKVYRGAKIFTVSKDKPNVVKVNLSSDIQKQFDNASHKER